MTVPDPRIDVSVSRVLDLLEKAKDWHVGEDERTADEESATEESSAGESDDDEGVITVGCLVFASCC